MKQMLKVLAFSFYFIKTLINRAHIFNPQQLMKYEAKHKQITYAR